MTYLDHLINLISVFFSFDVLRQWIFPFFALCFIVSVPYFIRYVIHFR